MDMSNSGNIYEGEYGVRESLLALKKREEEDIIAAINELESGIADKRAECDALASERDEKREQIEREYTIRINNNNKDIERLKASIEEMEKTQEKLKQELAECSFVAVGKKKTLSEKIEDNEKQLAKLNNNLRVTETTGQELIQTREKNLGRVDITLNRLKESMREVTDQIDALNEQLVDNKDVQKMYTELSDFDIYKLLNQDEVFREYVYALIIGAEKGLTFTELQHRNVIFALISNDRLEEILKRLKEANRINKLMDGDTAYFCAKD